MNHLTQSYPTLKIFLFTVLIGLTACSSNSHSPATAFQSTALIQAKTPPTAAIASAHPLATQAGFEILALGGNAFDAAIAVAAALAVVEPSGSGLGGGGFWLLHRASDNKQIMLDSRETAPLAASRDMYLDEQGKVIPRLSLDGALAAGIPGVPAALAHLAQHYGKLPLSTSLAPAIRYAEHGFDIDERLARLMAMRVQAIRKSSSAASIFLNQGEVPALGSHLVQKDLAETLKAIAAQGHAGFYSGIVAAKLVADVQNNGGIWTAQDLANYQVIERDPIIGQYQDIRIISAALPSSGGIVMQETLNILNEFELDSLPAADRIHLITEAWRRAYHDRAVHLGDKDFVEVPTERLLSHHYAQHLVSTIQMDKALPSEALSNTLTPIKQGNNTTHFSILDQQGNRVSTTLSINYPFGSGFVASGTGVLLNDEMDDFSAAPHAPNGYGLVGNSANAIAPGKRMLSSMSPTFLESDERIAILGTPGGSRIISMVCLAVLDFAAGHSPASWVSLPRFHHQYLPDAIQYEPDAISPSIAQKLQQRGHQLKASSRRYGNMQAIQWNLIDNSVQAASDPRGIGLALVK